MKLRRLRMSEVNITVQLELALVIVTVAWKGFQAAAGARVNPDALEGLSEEQQNTLLSAFTDEHNMRQEALNNLNDKLQSAFEAAKPLIGKPMQARYGGTCKVCGQSFQQGDEILWHERGVVSHVECPEPPVRPSPRLSLVKSVPVADKPLAKGLSAPTEAFEVGEPTELEPFTTAAGTADIEPF